MPAQDGASIVLAYGPQGAQQAGDSLMLQAISAPASGRLNSQIIRAPWSGARRMVALTKAPYEVSSIEDIEKRAPWSVADALQAEERAVFGVAAVQDRESQAPWGVYEGRVQPQPRVPWGVSAVRDRESAAPWGSYDGVAQPQSRAPWVLAFVRDVERASPWGSLGQLDIERVARYARGKTVDMEQWAPWSKFTTLLSPEWGIVIPVHTGDPEALYVVPVRSLYMVLNTSSLRRVEGDVAIPTFNLTISLDAGSWAWSFSATVPASAQDAIEPNEAGDPVELEALVNGTAFRLFAERIQRDRTFQESRLSISGRGKIAVLDAPYSPVFTFGNTEDRTAEQLIGDVLTYNGVTLGWDVTFSLTDWLVPANVFSYKGTYIAAVNEIAGAAGGYVLPHPSEQSFQVLAQYPTAPWDWGTLEPDYELPADYVTREGIEWLNKPKYNRVYVSGQQAGVLGQVTRTGTAGDLLAPMVTHALITEAAAARQRGLAILGDTGRVATVSLGMPVTVDTGGIILPGSIVRYVDGGVTRVGMARSVALQVGSPEVWQTIGVETHVEPV